MKKCFFLLSSCLSALLFFSCNTDAYDKGDGKYSHLCAELVEAHTNAEKLMDYVITDEGEQLPLTIQAQVSWATTPDSIYRALLYYNKVEAGAEPISISRIYTLVPHHIDTLKTDPIDFESAWLSTTRRYINLGIAVKIGATDDAKARQSIGLHTDTLVVNDNGTRTLHLRFYHDQAGIPEYYTQRTYVSIPTDSIEADTVHLRINTYNGVVLKTFSDLK